jgi:hypothetical protein
VNHPTYSLKNLPRYQHYKTRRPPWVKLHQDALSDPDFGSLPDAAKWFGLASIVLASRYDNAIPLLPDWLAQQTGSKNGREVESYLSDLQAIGFIEVSVSASNMLASCKQVARAETETETERETETTLVNDGADAPVDRVGDVTKKPNGKTSDRWLGWFESQFWPRYPRKVAKQAALKAWLAQRPKRPDAEQERCELILTCLEERKAVEWIDRPAEKKPHAATFLRAESFLESDVMGGQS